MTDITPGEQPWATALRRSVPALGVVRVGLAVLCATSCSVKVSPGLAAAAGAVALGATVGEDSLPMTLSVMVSSSRMSST